MHNVGRMLSAPFPVYWEGWRSTTAELAHRGWDLSVDESYQRQVVRLCMRHRHMELYAVTSAMNWSDAYHATMHGVEGPPNLPPFHVGHSIAREIVIQSVTREVYISPDARGSYFDGFKAIDPQPQFEMETMSGAVPRIFALASEQDILFEKADMTVVEHLEAIKALQVDKQAEIRERLRKAQRRADKVIQFPASRVVARLLEAA